MWLVTNIVKTLVNRYTCASVDVILLLFIYMYTVFTKPPKLFEGVCVECWDL
uniref:Uncharacterized protein n=1 Tax=Anguilla anguilla TaxID=7936 RepID=A0A0E9THH1_ANGAN